MAHGFCFHSYRDRALSSWRLRTWGLALGLVVRLCNAFGKDAGSCADTHGQR